MSGQIQTLPSTLPSYLLDSAHPDAPHSRANSLSVQPSVSPYPATSVSTSPPPPPPQIPPPSFSSPTAFQSADWDISSQEKANFDVYFSQLDSSSTGFIAGAAAVPFFSESGLPTHVLAQVW